MLCCIEGWGPSIATKTWVILRVKCSVILPVVGCCSTSTLWVCRISHLLRSSALPPSSHVLNVGREQNRPVTLFNGCLQRTPLRLPPPWIVAYAHNIGQNKHTALRRTWRNTFVQSTENSQRDLSGKTGEPASFNVCYPVGVLLLHKPGHCRWWRASGRTDFSEYFSAFISDLIHCRASLETKNGFPPINVSKASLQMWHFCLVNKPSWCMPSSSPLTFYTTLPEWSLLLLQPDRTLGCSNNRLKAQTLGFAWCINLLTSLCPV